MTSLVQSCEQHLEQQIHVTLKKKDKLQLVSISKKDQVKNSGFVQIIPTEIAYLEGK